MAKTFTEIRAALTEIVERTNANRKRLEQARQLIATADTDLGAMPAAYTGIVNDLDAAATANPGNAGWTTMKAEKDLIVADFQALKTAAAALKTAVAE